MRRYDKQYWDKFTHNDWRIPFSYKEKEKSLNPGIKDRGIANIRNIKKVSKEKILNRLEKNLLINLDY